MLYGQYLVTSCGIVGVRRGEDLQKQYECEMVSQRGHSIGFTLALNDWPACDRDKKKYEIISQFIKEGKLLHCEFAFRWYEYYFQLCLSNIMRCRISVHEYADTKVDMTRFLNGSYPYADGYGKWAGFSGLINLHGEVVLPTWFNWQNYPRFTTHEKMRESGALVWKPKETHQQKKPHRLDFIRTLLSLKPNRNTS